MKYTNLLVVILVITGIVLCGAYGREMAALTDAVPVFSYSNTEETAGVTESSTVPPETTVPLTTAPENTVPGTSEPYHGDEQGSNSDETAPMETAHEHSYAVSQQVEPSCCENGYTAYVCECGDNYTEDMAARGYHNWTKWEIIKEPTTEAEGVKSRNCTDCGLWETKSIDKVAAKTYVVTDVEAKKKYASTSLNLRSGPGTQYDKLATIPLNTEVTVIGEVDNGWVKVLYQDKEYFCAGNYLMGEKKEIATDASQPTGTVDGVLVGEAGASASVVNKAVSYWNNSVPGWLREKFKNSGWKIVVSGTPLNQRFGYSSSIAGITFYKDKTIYLDNRESAVKRSMIHELGHFIDWLNGYPSKSDEFKEIFDAEKDVYCDVGGVGDGHHISNVKEYFASVFRDIIVNGAGSVSEIPRTYEFISKYMG